MVSFHRLTALRVGTLKKRSSTVMVVPGTAAHGFGPAASITPSLQHTIVPMTTLRGACPRIELLVASFWSVIFNGGAPVYGVRWQKPTCRRLYSHAGRQASWW